MAKEIKTEKSELFGHITIPLDEKAQIQIEDYLTEKVTYFTAKGNKININEPIYDKYGDIVTENVIGIALLIENSIIIPNKFWIYTIDNKKYLLYVEQKK